MKRALVKLNNSHGKYYDIDIDSLKREVTNMVNSSKVSKVKI
jgi:hypothetical protein